MNRRTKYPAGSPKDVLIKMRRSERDIRQLLRDVQSCNDNNPNFADCPLDTGRYVVQLKKTRDVIKQIEDSIAAGEPMLPSDILKPLCEDW